MKVDIWKTAEKDSYLFLPQGNPFSVLPQAVLDQCGSLQFFQTLNLAPGVSLANPEAIELDLQKQGYSLRGPEGMISFAA